MGRAHPKIGYLEIDASVSRRECCQKEAAGVCQVRRTDGRRRTIHRGTTPAPFSTAHARRCMKSLAHTPHCRRASQHLAEVCLCSAQTSSSCPGLASFLPSTPVRTAAPPSADAGLMQIEWGERGVSKFLGVVRAAAGSRDRSEIFASCCVPDSKREFS